jgi:hypothetical protein
MRVMHESARRVQRELTTLANSADCIDNDELSSSSASASASSSSSTTEVIARRYNMTPAAARQALQTVDWRGNEPLR